MSLGCTYCTNVCPSPFHQCKVTLNTIRSEMKSTPLAEVCCPLAAGIEQMFFCTVHIELRHIVC